ncbi:MAG: thiol reductant ABC exporter subunit CydD [Burkholderiales bacterium]|nr:MAG: thiol reductant ABC exporter subunit CydD [Burkholderiales bacterium]
MSSPATTADPASPPASALAWLKGLQHRDRATRLWLGLASAAAVLGAGLAIAQAWLLSGLLAGVALAPAAGLPAIALSVLAAVLVLRGLLAWVRHRAGAEAGRRVREQVRRDALDGFAALARSERPGAAAASARLMEQVEALDDYHAHYLSQLALVLAMPPMIAAAVLPYSWIAALGLLATAPVIPMFMVLIGRSVEAASQRQFDQLARMGGQFLDLLKGLPTLKLLGRGPEQAEVVAASADGYRRSTLAVLRIAFLSSAVLELFASVAIALTAVYLGLSLLGRIDAGFWGGGIGLREALFVLLLAPEFYQPLRQLGAHYHARGQALGAAPDLIALMPRSVAAAVPQPADPRSPGASPAQTRIGDAPVGAFEPVPAGPVGLVFQNVGLRHADGRLALDGVDLRIEPGERVAIVGESGVGKTSLLDVALGLAAPTAGRVLANGVDLARADVSAWRARLAWVGQRPDWFAGSLRENIRLACPGAGDAAVERAALRAGVAGFAEGLPSGLDTPLGEDGAGLSGGQLQRVAFARAWLRDAPLWLLDEPTAHLDQATAAGLLQTLSGLSQGRTLLFVTHRQPDARLFDRVVTLAGGRVVSSAALAAPDDEELPEPCGAVQPAPGLAATPTAPHGALAATEAAGRSRGGPGPVPLVALAWCRRGPFALSLLLGLITVFAGTGLLALSGWFISAAAVAGLGVASAAAFEIFRPGAVIRLFAMLRTAGRYGERLISHDATLRLLADLRVWAFRRMEPLAPGRLAGARSGDLLQRLVGDVDALDGLFLRTAAPAIQAWVLTALVTVGLALAFGATAALATAATLVLAIVVLPALLVRQGDRLGRASNARQALLRQALVENLRGVTTLQVYGGWSDARATLLAHARRWQQLQARLDDVEGWSQAASLVLGGVAALVLLVIAAPQAGAGDVAGPWLVGGVLMVLGLSEVHAPLSGGFLYAGQQRAAAQRLAEVAAMRPAVRFPERGCERPQSADLSVRGLGFTYVPGRPVLSGLDLDLPAGSHLALMGPSGCGKSTLVALLARCMDPDTGRIELGGRPLAAYSERRLRQLVTLVPQHAHVFDASLADNLRFAAPQANERVLWRALEVAQLADWVRAQPQGIETRAGTFGSALSGGQARRLGVARALLREAPIVMLDEPGEGLDPATEARLIAALRGELAGRTLLVVTHRPAVAVAMGGVLRLA